MKLADAQRIHDEAPARALWQDGGDALTFAALDDIIARKEAVEAWVGRRTRVLGWIVAAIPVGFFIIGFFVDLGPDPVSRVILGFMFWALAWMAIAVRYPIFEDEDLSFARKLRGDLAHEAERLQRLRARIAAGTPFALYLRTFGTETAAMTAAQVREEADSITANVEVDPTDPAQRHLYASRARLAHKLIAGLKDEWSLKRGIIEKVAARLPVVCLGNINLQAEKRADLARLGVEDATLIKSDWWAVFQEAEAAATLTFVVLDAFTTHITRELDHLMGRGRPFLVICTADTDRRLAVDAGYKALIAHPAVRHAVVAEDDLGALDREIGGLISPTGS